MDDSKNILQKIAQRLYAYSLAIIFFFASGGLAWAIALPFSSMLPSRMYVYVVGLIWIGLIWLLRLLLLRNPQLADKYSGLTVIASDEMVGFLRHATIFVSTVLTLLFFGILYRIAF